MGEVLGLLASLCRTSTGDAPARESPGHRAIGGTGHGQMVVYVSDWRSVITRLTLARNAGPLRVPSV